MSHTKITAVFQKLFLSTTLHWTLSATLKSGPDRKYTHDTALAVLSVRAALTDHDVHDVASGPEIGQRKDRASVYVTLSALTQKLARNSKNGCG